MQCKEEEDAVCFLRDSLEEHCPSHLGAHLQCFSRKEEENELSSSSESLLNLSTSKPKFLRIHLTLQSDKSISHKNKSYFSTLKKSQSF